MSPIKKLCRFLGILFVLSFGALLSIGSEIYGLAPLMPEHVVAEDGRDLFTLDEIQRGRQVWQSMGGHQLGSIWGHGSYVAPNWTTDRLHREITALLKGWARRDYRGEWANLSSEQQAVLWARRTGQSDGSVRGTRGA